MPNGGKTNKENLRKLYDKSSDKFDVGTWEEFQGKMDDTDKRKRFYDKISTQFDLGDYAEYESRLKKKEIAGKGLQADWESVSKYEQDNPIEIDIPTLEEFAARSEQAQREQVQEQLELPAEVQPAEAQLPSELEQTEILKQVNPEEAQRIEAEKVEADKISIAEQQDDTEKAAKGRVYAFAQDYKATLEEADQMGFDTFESYADHFKPAAAEEFLKLDADKKEFNIRQQIDELEAARKAGAPISTEQIEAAQQEADNIRTQKFKDINKDISELRDLLAKGYHEDVGGGKITRVERTPLAPEEQEQIRNEIKLLEGMRSDVFETDPKKLANRSKEVIEESDAAKTVLSRVTETMPEGLNGKERFDRYYNILYKRYRDQAEKAGYDVKEGEVVDEGFLSRLGLAARSVTGIMTDDEKELIELFGTLRQLTPIYLLNQSPIKEREGFWNTFWTNLGGGLGGVVAEAQAPREQLVAQTIQETFGAIGIKPEELQPGVGEAITEVGKEYTYDDWEGAKKRLAMLTSNIANIGIKYAVGGGITSNILKGTKIGKALNTLSKQGKLEGTTNLFMKNLSKAPGVTKFLARGTEEGLKFAGAGQIFREDQDELNFLSGFLGRSVGQLVEGMAAPMINKIYGMFGKATPKIIQKIEGYGSRGIGELGEESMQELYQTYKATENGKEFLEELERRFGKTSDKLEFILSSILMGTVFHSTNTDHVSDFYNNEATSEEKAIIDEVSREVTNDITQSVNSAVEETTAKTGITEEKEVSEEVPTEAEVDVVEGSPQVKVEGKVEEVAEESAISEAEKSVSEVEATPKITAKVEEKEASTEVTDLEKPIEEINIEEEGNYNKVISYLKSIESDLDEFGKETLGSNLPVVIAKSAVTTIRKSIEAGKAVADAVKDGIRVVTESEWYKNLNREQQTEFTDKFAENINNRFFIKKPKKKSVKAQIKETIQPKAEKVVTNEKKLLRERIRNLSRGAREGAKATKQSIKEAITEGLEPLKGKLTPAQTRSIVSKATATNYDSSKAVAKLEEHIDKVTSKVNYTEDIKIARSISRKLKKAVKQKKVPIEMEKIAKQVANIPVQKLDSIEDYNRIAEGIEAAITGKATAIPKDVDKLLKEADAEIKAYDRSVENRRLRNEYETSPLKAEMSFSDYKILSETTKETDPETVEDEPKKKRAGKRSFLEGVLPFRLQDVSDLAKDEDVNLDARQRKTLNTLKDVDIDELTTGQLVELNNIITSIMEFDSYSRVGELEVTIEANKKAKEFSKYEDRFRAPNFLASAMTTTTFMKQIVVGGRAARQFAGDLIGDLNTGYNKAMTKSDKFNKKVNDAFKNISPEQNRKMGMIGFVVQTQGGTDVEMQAEFEDRKKAVLGTVEALRKLGSTPKKTGRRKAKRYSKKADKLEAAYNEYLADANTIDEAIGKLNENELKTYEFLKGEFDKIKDDLADSQSRYNGKEFVEYENYLPTEARPINKFAKDEFNIEDPDSPPGVNFVDTRQAGTTIERQPVDTEGGTVYNFDMFDMVKRKYYESVYDIGTLRERKVLNKVINNKDFKESLGSEVSKALSKKMQSMISTQKRQDYNSAIELPPIIKQVAKLIRLGKRVKLSTVDQILKQPIPVLAHTAIYNNPLTVGKAISELFKTRFDSEYKDAFNELIAGSDVANRVLLGDTVADREMREEFDKLSDNDLLTNFNRVRERIANASSWSLLTADNMAAKISWLSSYMYALQQQGVNIKDFDLVAESKNINEKAKVEADGRADDINNVSDFSKTADIFKGKTGAAKALREMLWNFKSFSLNAGMNTIVEIRNLSSKDTSREEKMDSFKYIVGFVAQQAIFNALKIYAINVMWDALAGLIFGGEPKEETEEERFKKFAANTGAELIGSVIPSMGEEVLRDIANRSYKSYKSKEVDDIQGGKRIGGPKVKGPSQYSDKLFYVDDNKMLGSYTIPFDLAEDITETLTTIAKGEEFKKSDYLKLGSIIAFFMSMGDLDRLFSKSYWRVKREEKNKKKGGKKLRKPQLVR